jgi:hypothetical protein
VTFIQRFGDALNLNVHFHMLAQDGVYKEVAGDSAASLAIVVPSWGKPLFGTNIEIAGPNIIISNINGTGLCIPSPSKEYSKLPLDFRDGCRDFNIRPQESCRPELRAFSARSC